MNTKIIALIAAVLMAACAAAPHEQIVYQARCYHYAHFTGAEYNQAADWLDAQPESSVPALMLEDYIRLRAINECSEDASILGNTQ